jgi:hypothetical protein
MSRYWNYKTALMSALLRGLMLLAVNIRFGWKAASGVMLVESLYRFATSGLFGSWTERLSRWQPRWQATLLTAAAIPAVATILEFFILAWKGTPDLRGSMIASIVTTAFASLLNLHVQRHGLLTADRGDFFGDLKRLPAVVFKRS